MAVFEWEVSGSGYEIARLGRDLDPLDRFYGAEAVVIKACKTDAQPTVYRPLEDVPDLALRFKNLGAASADRAAFANTYGLLGLDARDGGELYAEWSEQISAVGKVFRLWDIHEGRIPWEQARLFVDDVRRLRHAGANPTVGVDLPRELTPAHPAGITLWLNAEDRPYFEGRLSPLVENLAKQQQDPRNEEPRDLVWHESSPRMIASPSLRDRLDTMKPAARMRALRPWLREQIAETVNPNLYKYCGAGFAFLPTGQAGWMTHQPRSLLGAIWLQVVWHLEGKARYRECARRKCGKWFVTDLTKAGRRKWFCSETCKHADWKARKAAENRRGRQARKGRQ